MDHQEQTTVQQLAILPPQPRRRLVVPQHRRAFTFLTILFILITIAACLITIFGPSSNPEQRSRAFETLLKTIPELAALNISSTQNH